MTYGVPCEGWWQEIGYGRQPMCDLRLQFDGGRISGSGHDIVGLFTFRGTLSDEGRVVMVKRYLGQHSVDYVGQYDGEGILWGDWHIGHLTDQWLIKIKNTTSSALDDLEVKDFTGSTETVHAQPSNQLLSVARQE